MTITTLRATMSATFLIFLMACAGASQSGSPGGSQKVLAVVNGEQVTEDAVRKAVGADLETLEMKKMQAQIGFQRDEQSILERSLTSIVDNKIVEAEAKKRGVTPPDLIQAEVEKKVPEPSDKDVAAFYQENKGRINMPPDEALRQIRLYLRQQNREPVYQAFMSKLRNDYKVTNYLEPLRTPVATQGFPTKGVETAPVTIVEFSDFECPYCAQLFPTLQLIEAKYGDKVRVVFRQFPLVNLHPHAQKAAEASLCAYDQKKFWELHDAMFKDRTNLDVDALKKKAAALDMDTKAFDACLDASKHEDAIQKDVSEGVKVGITGTPAMFINGRFLNGAQPYNEIAKVIDEELKKK